MAEHVEVHLTDGTRVTFDRNVYMADVVDGALIVKTTAEDDSRGYHWFNVASIAWWKSITEPEPAEPEPTAPDRRLPACVEAWPNCAVGEYNPACCRFPKSCSCMPYDDQETRLGDVESGGSTR